MNVNETIAELLKIKDKTKKVTVDYSIEIISVEETEDGDIELRY